MPIKYVPFIPEPVEGQAVLGNFNRILRYKGADDVSMTLQRGMPLYEMEKQETVGENADGNMVIRGECVSACAYLKEQGIQVDLVYIDPPYDSDTHTFNSYTDTGFDKEEQKRLASVFKKLDNKGVKVMLSNHNTSLINELYKGFNIHVIDAKRSINANGNKRGKVEEVIITNY